MTTVVAGLKPVGITAVVGAVFFLAGALSGRVPALAILPTSVHGLRLGDYSVHPAELRAPLSQRIVEDARRDGRQVALPALAPSEAPTVPSPSSAPLPTPTPQPLPTPSPIPTPTPSPSASLPTPLPTVLPTPLPTPLPVPSLLPTPVPLPSR